MEPFSQREGRRMIWERKTKLSKSKDCELLRSWLDHFLSKGRRAEIHRCFNGGGYAVYVADRNDDLKIDVYGGFK